MALIRMFDTNTVIYLMNRDPGYEHIARRMSGRYRSQNREALAEWLALVEVEDFPLAAAADFARGARHQ